jgi:CDP-diacylglycerol--serine O-phosphatidyltransferase
MARSASIKENIVSDTSGNSNKSVVSSNHANDKDINSPDRIRSKGIYLLPNLFTIGNIFAGFFAIVSAMNNNYKTAAIAIFVAMVFDLLDGRVARLINAQSEFGAQLDSLADVISFGITPALVIYNWTFLELKSVGWAQAAWLGSFLYVACGALRLAKFNIQEGTEDENLCSLRKKYFIGLPIPAAAAVIASLVWISEIYSWNKMLMGFVAAGVATLVALSMVSNILYRSFKDLDLKRHVKFILLVWIVVGYMVFWRYPAQTLFAMSFGYFVSGPISHLIKMCRSNR